MLRYNPSLDGIRAIAILAVVAFHATTPLARGGFVGVDVFFVLSGFLITSILRGEIEQHGSIRVARFYGHRFLRLYPSLALVLVAFLAAAPSLWPDEPAGQSVLLAAMYLTDYSSAFWQAPEVLRHTWSLSVEEHFYLLWPLALPMVVRARNPVATLAMIYVAATVWRVTNAIWLGWDMTYYRFDTRLSGLVLGAMLSYVGEHALVRRWSWFAWPAIVLVIVGGAHRQVAGLVTAIPVAELATALMILTARATPSHRLLSAAPMVYIGKLSYGIYLWHFPIAVWLRPQIGWEGTFAWSLGLSIGAAAVTYHFIDLPLQRWRHRNRTAAYRASEERGQPGITPHRASLDP
ncbi:acyltransferase family protein [Stenotrophomonas pigmentata]|uniref:acyltransferase family protein n=1 Tax=Stenotrophomonas pigmentata TaxID=3055080 RepID=UPI0026F33F90|nr:acyltransferase [Stenotrophomonas sp. 610A2]